MVTQIEIILSNEIQVEVEVKLLLLKNHASLSNLDYEHSGHTGFASKLDLDDYVSKAEFDDADISEDEIDRILDN